MGSDDAFGGYRGMWQNAEDEVAALRSELQSTSSERDRYRQALTDIAGWENWQRPTWREIAQDALVYPPEEERDG